MAGSTLKVLKYFRLIKKLFPTGWAWDAKDDKSTDMSKLLNSLAYEPCRVDDRALELINEVFPDTTLELLTDWERFLGLPDECDPDGATTIQERRNRVIQVLTTEGGQNADYFKRLAANFGFDIDVIEVSDQPPFRAGQGRAGDKLTNGDWRYTFIIEAPSDSIIRFRAGQSSAGDPLLKVSNEVLECLIQRDKPAHTIALFSFGGI